MTHATITPSTSTGAAVAPNTRVRHGSESTLRLVLRVNAVSSAVAGGLLAAIPYRIDELLDTGHPGWVRVVGLALLPFAAFYAWASTSSVATMRRATPWIIAGDIAWVTASVATVLAGWYSGGGVVAVLAMAALVDAFALLQWRSWRRLPVTH